MSQHEPMQALTLIMRTIPISQLKDDSYTTAKLIEQSICIDKSDLNNSLSSVKDLTNDLLSLKQAVFIKTEKLKLQYKETEQKYDNDKIQELIQRVSEIEIGPLGSSKEVLHRNKDIYELKLLHKVCKHFIEVESNNIQVLRSLCRSEEKEDWSFLCFFIKKTLNFYTADIKAKVKEIQKEIQTKLINIFNDGKKYNNKTMMKNAYSALNELDDNNTLIQKYVYDIDIFNKVYDMIHDSKKHIDIELYEEERNSFYLFMKEIRSAYETNFTELQKFVCNDDEAYKLINKKIFNDLIFPTLERFLDNTIPFVFLYSMENAYLSIFNLCVYIETCCTYFDKNIVLDEARSKFSARSVDKERSFFSEIFNILVYGNSTFTTYDIYGEKVAECKDNIKIVKVLLTLIDKFRKRSEFLYSKEDISDMHVFYFENINKLLSKVYDNNKDKIEVICIIQEVYYTLMKYYKTDIYKMDIFNELVKILIEKSLMWKVEQCYGRIKHIVSSLLFHNLQVDLYFVEYLKLQIYESKRLEGTVRLVFVHRIFDLAYKELKAKILVLKYTDIQKKNLQFFLDRLLYLVRMTSNTTIIKNYKCIESLVLLITCERSNLQDIFDMLRPRLDKKDIKKALQCRKEKLNLKPI